MGYYDDWVDPNGFFRGGGKRLGGRSRTLISPHAGMRLHERYPDANRETFEAAVRGGNFEYKKRMTGTRSLCLTVVGRDDVWFIYSRTEQVVVTVLTAEQAESVQ